MNTRPPIAAFIRRLRHESQTTVAQLRDRLKGVGITLEVRALQRYEAGAREPSMFILVAIADILGATNDEWASLRAALSLSHDGPPAPGTPRPGPSFPLPQNSAFDAGPQSRSERVRMAA